MPDKMPPREQQLRTSRDKLRQRVAGTGASRQVWVLREGGGEECGTHNTKVLDVGFADSLG